MRVVIQRVLEANVKVNNIVVGQITRGLLVFAGIEDADTQDDILWLSSKIVNLRILNDASGVMNKSVKDNKEDILVVSQFTLHASTKKGNRPSYIRASKAAFAATMYENLKAQLTADLGKPLQSGVFGADMKVSLINDGPVTIIIDTKNKE